MKSSLGSLAVSSDEDFESPPSRYVPNYHFKALKDKGAIVVILWTFSAFFAFHVFSPIWPQEEKAIPFYPYVFFILSLLLYPVFGGLADMRYGRYRVIKWSLRALWVISILFCMTSGLLQYVGPSSYSWLHHSFSTLWYVTYAPMIFLIGGFVVNAIQLGLDQLADASSGEIVSYFHWFVWVWFCSGFAAALSQSCTCLDYKSVSYFFVPLFLTLAVVLDCNFNHLLVKEPVADNPVTLIFKVLRYALRNKYPRHQSTLTYWDDGHHSRLDLAKDTFGGPFTSKQVDDVKCFFRIFTTIIAGAIFCALYIVVFPQFDKVMYHLHDNFFIKYNPHNQCDHDYLRDCFQRFAVKFAGPLLLVFGLPLFEFVLYPLFKKYIQFFILQKLSIGLVLFLLSIIASAVIELVAHLKSHKRLKCPLDTHEPNHLPLDYKWVIIMYSLSSTGQYLLMTSFGEFLCAQSPHSMKGLLFGLSFGAVAFFSIIDYFLLKLIKILSQRIMPDRHYGCLFWYFILVLGILVVALSFFLIMLKCYKKRVQRDGEN